MSSFRSIYSYWHKSRENISWLFSYNMWLFVNIKFFKKIITHNLLYFIEFGKNFSIKTINVSYSYNNNIVIYIFSFLFICISFFI